MSRRDAESVADALGGEAVPAGDGGWSVRIERGDGRVVVISGRSVDEFYDREAESRDQCYASISLA